MHPFLFPWTGRAAACRLTRRVCLLVGLTLALVLPAQAEVLRLTNDSTPKGGMQLNSAGQVLWGAGNRLYLWSGGAARQLAQNPPPLFDPLLGEGGQVVWIEGGQVSLWDGRSIQHLPSPASVLGGALGLLAINRAGHVVWADIVGHLSFWDGGALRLVPATGRYNGQLLLNDLDEVLWLNQDGLAQLYLWDGATVRTLSSGRAGVVSAVFNQEGHVVWDAAGIHLWDGESARELFSGWMRDQGPDLNPLDQVTWVASNGANTEIYLWDGATVRQISANGRSNHDPFINRAGQVVWESDAGSEREVLFWDGAQVRRLSAAGVNGSGPLLNDAGQVVWVEAPDNKRSWVMLWDGASLHRLAGDDGRNGTYPLLNPAGQVAWTSTNGTQSDIYLYTPTTPDALVLQPSHIVGGRAATGVLTLPAPAPPGGTAIDLTSDQPAAAVPAQVKVPVGRTSVTFPVETSPVSRATAAVITAASDAETWQVTLSVGPPTLVFVRTDPSSLTGGLSGQGTVMLSGTAPRGGVGVTLTSDHPALATVPASVTVPGGARSTHFRLSTAAVSTSTEVNLTASAGGESRAAKLTVSAVAITGIRFQPGTVANNHSLRGTQTATGTVTLSGPAPAVGAVVKLANENDLAATVPGHVIVPAGASSASFPVTTFGVDRDTTVEIRASYGGSTQHGTLLIVALTALAVQFQRDPVVAGETVTGTLTLDGTAPSSGAVVTLESANPAAASVPASVTVPGTAYRADFSVVTHAVDIPTAVGIKATRSGLSQTGTLTVIPDALPSVTVAPSNLFSGQSATVTLTLRQPAPPGGAVVTVKSIQAGWDGLPASITVPAGQRTAASTVMPPATQFEIFRDLSFSYQGVTRTVTLHVLPLLPTGLTLDSAVIVGGGTVQATLTLNGMAALGASVSLTNSNPAAVTAPASVPVAPGAAAATFILQTRPVTSPASAVLEATLSGVSQQATLIVLPVPGAAPAFFFGVVPDQIISGDSAVGAVAIAQPAPAGGWAIALSTDKPGYIDFPPRVVVPEGATTATFPVKATGVGDVSISAAAGGVVQTVSLRLLPVGLSFEPDLARGGQDVTGTVVLPSPAPPGGVVVTFNSDRSVIRPPDSITVPAGERRVSFPVQTFPVTSGIATSVTAFAFINNIGYDWRGVLLLDP